MADIINQTFRIPGKVLAEFMRSRAYFQVIRGPLGSAKTTTAFAKTLKLFQDQRPDESGVRRSRVAAIRSTYPELTSILIPDVRKLLRPEMGKIVMGHPPQANLAYKLPDGTSVEAEIIFLAVDRPDDIRKLRGMQLTFCWFNELRFVVDASIVAEALSRCDRYPAPGWSPWVGGLADTNAWSEEDWIEEMATGFLDAEMANQLGAWEFFIQPPGVVRTDAADPEGYKSLSGNYWSVNKNAENILNLKENYYGRQIAQNKDDWIRVNLANQLGFSLAGKPVHPEYSEERHRAKKDYTPSPNLPIWVGLDFGMTSAALYLQKDLNGVWHAFDEIVLEDGGVPSLAQCIHHKNSEWAGKLSIEMKTLNINYVGDPSGDYRKDTDERTAYQVLSTNGIYAVPARGNNDVTIRREAMRRVLTRLCGDVPGFQASPRCRVFRKGMASGFIYKRLKVSGMEAYKDSPDKNSFSHIVEAGEYALLNGGEHAVINAPKGMQGRRPITPATPKDWNVFDV